MKNEQHKDNRTFKLIKKVRISISIKKNEILDKKKRDELRYNFKEIRIEIIIFNIYEVRKTTVHKKLSRRFCKGFRKLFTR